MNRCQERRPAVRFVMPWKCAPRGIPVPSLLQASLIALAVCAGFVVWSQWSGSVAEPVIERDREDDEVASALDHLRELEAIAREGALGLPELIAELTNPNPRLRRNALLALRQLGL